MIETDVAVVGAPGYEDFFGALLLPDAGTGFAIVGFEVDGERKVAAIPAGCIHPIGEDAGFSETV